MQPAGQHADGQRQESAEPNYLGDGSIVGGHVRAVSEPDKQRYSVICLEGVQAHRGRVVQRGQVAPAGHQHQGARRTRQQRPDLFMARRVVQQ